MCESFGLFTGAGSGEGEAEGGEPRRGEGEDLLGDRGWRPGGQRRSPGGAFADLGLHVPARECSPGTRPRPADGAPRPRAGADSDPLDTPKSTTQLFALTGLRLGSVGRHLKILLDAPLVQRRRAGRSVLHSRTQPGNTLVDTQPVTSRTG